MSTSDQTKSKLLDSMRVSKQGIKQAPDAENTSPVKKTATVKKTGPVKKTATVKKTVAASRAKAAPAIKAKASKKAATPAASKETASDSFQAAKRVWPD